MKTIKKLLKYDNLKGEKHAKTVNVRQIGTMIIETATISIEPKLHSSW